MTELPQPPANTSPTWLSSLAIISTDATRSFSGVKEAGLGGRLPKNMYSFTANNVSISSPSAVSIGITTSGWHFQLARQVCEFNFRMQAANPFFRGSLFHLANARIETTSACLISPAIRHSPLHSQLSYVRKTVNKATLRKLRHKTRQ